MRVFVGLGEGIGNVIMGTPLIDLLLRRGDEVTVGLLPTPPALASDLFEILKLGRSLAPAAERYDATYLTGWWCSRAKALGIRPPPATDTFPAPPPHGEAPEILQNLELASPTAEERAHPDFARAEIHIRRTPVRQGIAIHPGCKPTWRKAKLYPRWAEVIHMLEDDRIETLVVGGVDDRDIYCGRPGDDIRGDCSLMNTAAWLSTSGVFLSGDSGLHHLAVALGVASIAIFGQSSTEKARHPNPRRAPLVLGPFDAEQFPKVSPLVIARAVRRAID